MKVAVKGIKHETEKEKNDFIREMSIMSKILHPNIVRLYGLVLRGLFTHMTHCHNNNIIIIIENLIVLEFMHQGRLGNFLKVSTRVIII